MRTSESCKPPKLSDAWLMVSGTPSALLSSDSMRTRPPSEPTYQARPTSAAAPKRTSTTPRMRIALVSLFTAHTLSLDFRKERGNQDVEKYEGRMMKCRA